MNQHGFIGYEELLAEIKTLRARIAELEHQHKDEVFANKLLLATIEELKNAL